MAKSARKVQRAAARKAQEGSERKAQRNLLKQPLVKKLAEAPELKPRAQLKSMAFRLGLPVLAAWMIGLFVFGWSHGALAKGLALGLPALVTALAVGVVVWALRQANKAQSIASILSGIESEEDRQSALSELEQSSKKKDVAAIFAKAQLELQSDPERALATLETIDLNKVMAPVADEARAQRAMIHLLQGQVSLARQLVDNIELKRHQEPKTRAMLTAILAEAWARSGKPKQALDTLAVISPEDEIYRDLQPQLYRALAFAHAYANQSKEMRRALKRLLDHDVRLLGGFLTKRTHPLLQKEAKRLAEQSGQIPRKMLIQRRP